MLPAWTFVLSCVWRRKQLICMANLRFAEPIGLIYDKLPPPRARDDIVICRCDYIHCPKYQRIYGSIIYIYTRIQSLYKNTLLHMTESVRLPEAEFAPFWRLTFKFLLGIYLLDTQCSIITLSLFHMTVVSRRGHRAHIPWLDTPRRRSAWYNSLP